MNPDIAAKAEKVKQLSAAIVRIQAKRERTVEEAIELNHLINQRRELRGLLPPLRVVAGTDHDR